MTGGARLSALIALALVASAGVSLVAAGEGDGADGARLFTAWGQPISRPASQSAEQSGGQYALGVGVPPRGLDDNDAETCMGCHIDIGDEWRESLHRRSYSDAIFQAGYRADPLPMCRDCHAPLAKPGQAMTEEAAETGVSCSVCHVRDGRILATRVSADGQRAHPMRLVPELASSELCASCHQFRFPAAGMVERLIFDPTEFMQKTFAEWRASPAHARGQTCQDCHMPRVGAAGSKHRSHRFPGLRDLDFVRRAVTVHVEAHDRGQAIFVRAAVEAHGVGHSLPTGDMFRLVVLRIWPEGRPDLERRIEMGREFGPRALVTTDSGDANGEVTDVTLLRAEKRDRRIRAGETRRFAFRLASPDAARVHYRLEIWRMSDGQAKRHRLGTDRTHIEITRGTVEVATRPR